MPIEVRNLSRGPRTVNVRNPGGEVLTRTLAPGETANVELANKEDPVFLGMVEAGELAEGGDKNARAKKMAEFEKKTKELEAELYEIQKERAALGEEMAVEKYLANPMARHERQGAMIAGTTPGLADPLPPGTDTEGGKESQAAKERLGPAADDPKTAREVELRVSTTAARGADAPKAPVRK